MIKSSYSYLFSILKFLKFKSIKIRWSEAFIINHINLPAMRKYRILWVIALIVGLFSCKEDSQPVVVEELKEYDVIGNAQKGPFINGSAVTIYDLDGNFKPTGRIFQVNTDAQGHFELAGVELSSGYAQIVADGFYYNEVSGNLSDERIMLKALVPLTSEGTININVLTNLEYERIRYLMASQAQSYQSAKNQAQNELLKVFNMESVQVGDAESLDIIQSEEGDAALLAVSAILQGKRSTAEVSKLQADMITDMKEDGILNDTVIQGSLISQSQVLNLDKIRENLITKYKELGIVLNQLNDFDQMVENFNLHSTFHFTPIFEFPQKTAIGFNFLALDFNKIKLDSLYAFAVAMPTVGKIKIKMKLVDGIKSFPWGYAGGENYGWKIEPYDAIKGEQTFTSTLNDVTIDVPIIFPGHGYGKALIEYYYGESTTPAKSRIITWGGYSGNGYAFQNSSAGLNLLALDFGSTIKNETSYVVGVTNGGLYSVKIKLLYPSTVVPQVAGGWGTYASKNISGGMEIELKGTDSGTGIVGGLSEIVLKFKGEGTVTIESDLKLSDGTFLKNKLKLVN